MPGNVLGPKQFHTYLTFFFFNQKKHCARRKLSDSLKLIF